MSGYSAIVAQFRHLKHRLKGKLENGSEVAATAHRSVGSHLDETIELHYGDQRAGNQISDTLDLTPRRDAAIDNSSLQHDSLDFRRVETIALDDCDDLIALSPSLTSLINDLQHRGWKIQYPSTDAPGSYVDYLKKRIYIQKEHQRSRPEEQAGVIAHEVGHARLPPVVRPSFYAKGPTEWVAQDKKLFMRGEGEATMFTCEIRSEIIRNGGPEIVVPGFHESEYVKIHGRVTNGEISRGQGVDEMAKLFETEITSTKDMPYGEFYEKISQDEYNRAHRSGRLQ
ncbi:hypothetical protein [Nocardia australiensis]|uniref:hypothetical protein n=1 Tax=Nocardia australiensis TaxID=2887191 RepID=UPI001D141196|nr:hypothetical protein [Nocardia australiensis]